MPATPELFKRAVAASIREFETLRSQETDPMEAYHHANYELSALLCVLSEQVNDEEVVDAVGEIIEQYEEIAERAGVDFSPYEGYEVNDAMSYEKAQTLAVAVVGQGFVSEIEDKVKAVALDFEDSENIEE